MGATRSWAPGQADFARLGSSTGTKTFITETDRATTLPSAVTVAARSLNDRAVRSAGSFDRARRETANAISAMPDPNTLAVIPSTRATDADPYNTPRLTR